MAEFGHASGRRGKVLKVLKVPKVLEVLIVSCVSTLILQMSTLGIQRDRYGPGTSRFLVARLQCPRR